MPRITDLTSASTVALIDTLVLVQSGTTKKCDVSQVKTLSASELVSGTLGVARLPVVPVASGGTGSTDAVSGLSALGGQPALTSAAPASIVQGGTGVTTAVAALNALGGITSAVVPSLVTTQLSAYTLLTTSAAFQNSAQVQALASAQIAAITPESIGALATSAASGFATTAQVVGIANTAQLAAFQNSAQVRALTTAQLSAISITAGTGLTGGGTIDASRTIALQTSGVAANIYGNNSTIPVINVDSFGRITGALSANTFTAKQTFAANSTTVNPFSFSTTASQALLTTTALGSVEWDNQQMYVTSSTPVAGLTRNPIATAMLLINNKTASYTLVVSDAGEMIVVNSASPTTITIPTQATANSNFPIGTQILIMQTGAAQVTIAGVVGVTVNSKNGVTTSGLYAVISLIKIAADTWVVAGDATI